MRRVITMDSTIKHDKHDKHGSLPMGPLTRACTCGQQLDMYACAHCPRCGRTLTRR